MIFVEYLQGQNRLKRFDIFSLKKFICRSLSSKERAFNANFEDIPKAPGNGLVLRQVHYDTYNKDYGAAKGNLEWQNEQNIMDKFALEKILPHIFKRDIGK